jgi:hypothetical protein
VNQTEPASHFEIHMDTSWLDDSAIDLDVDGCRQQYKAL